MQIITIVKDDRVTGVEYGTVEIPDKELKANTLFNTVKQKRIKIQSTAYRNAKHK